MSIPIGDLLIRSCSVEISDQERQEITQNLLNLFKEPPTIFSIIPLIYDKSYPKRQLAIICFGKCINYCWNEEEIDPSYKESLKNTFLDLLSKETDILLAKNLIDFSEKIYETEAKRWPELVAFIQNISSSPLGVKISMYLTCSIARYIDTEIIEGNFGMFQQILSTTFNSQDPETIMLSLEMTGVLLSFLSPATISTCSNQESFLLQHFMNYLALDPNSFNPFYMNRIVCAIADSFQADVLAIPTADLTTRLLEMLNSENFPKDRSFYVFNALEWMFKYHAMELIDVLEPILKTALFCCAMNYNPEDTDSISNANSIAFTIGSLAGELQIPTFIKSLRSLLSENSEEPFVFAYAYILYHSIDECENEVSNDIKPIIDTTVSFLNSPNPYIKEIGTLISVILGDSLEPSQVDIAVTLLQNLIPCISSGLPNLIRNAFNAINSILAQGLISTTLLTEMLPLLISLLSNDQMNEFQSCALETMSNLIFAVTEDIRPYARDILPILMSAASLDRENPDFNLIREQAITALGMLFRFASDILHDNLQQGVEIILNSADCTDIDMNHSVIFAIGNLVLERIEILMNYRERIIEIIDNATQYLFQHILSYDDSNNNEEQENKLFDYAIRGFTDTLMIIKWIFKKFNELSPESPTQWMATILHFMKAPYPELQCRSISAGMYGTAMIMKFHPEQPPDYFKCLYELLGSEDPTVVGKCFRAFSYLIRTGIPIPGEFLNGSIKAAMDSLNNSLPFQQSKSFDIHDSNHLFKFFKTLFLTNSEAFPLQQYVSLGNHFINSNRQLYEIFQYIKILNLIYLNSHASLKSLTKKILIKQMVQCYQRYGATFTDEDVEYAAFSVPPFPLKSMCLLLQFEPNAIQGLIPSIFELVFLIFNHEFNGEKYYYYTVTNAIEFVLISYQLSPGSFDINTWLPLILSKLPVPLMSNEKLTDHIYTVLFSLMGNNEYFQKYGMEMVRILVQTLGKKDKLFSRYHLLPQTYTNILSFVNQAIASQGGSLDQMKSFFDDNQSFSRFCSRIAAPPQPPQ